MFVPNLLTMKLIWVNPSFRSFRLFFCPEVFLEFWINPLILLGAHVDLFVTEPYFLRKLPFG